MAENRFRPPCLRADSLLISFYVSLPMYQEIHDLAAPVGPPLLSCGRGASFTRLAQDTITLLANVGNLANVSRELDSVFFSRLIPSSMVLVAL